MLPSDIRSSGSPASNTPDCTSAMSTPLCAANNRLRLSNEPSVVTIFSVMPLCARIFLYCSATKLNRLPGAPLAIVRLFGGAGRTKCKATKMTIALIMSAGPSVRARSNHPLLEFPRSTRANKVRSVALSSVAGASPSIALFYSLYGHFALV